MRYRTAGYEEWVGRLMAKLGEVIMTDEYTVAIAALEGYAELLTGVGERLLQRPEHLSIILTSVSQVFHGKVCSLHFAYKSMQLKSCFY